jgi:TRAP-type C4-dicarboxylate transport system substrate-binding protein
MDLTKSAYAGFRLYEVVPFLTETAHIWAVGILHIGEKVWQTLNDDERDAFSAAGSEAARHFNALIVEDEVRSVAQALAKGARIIQPARRKDWELAARPIWDSFAASVGGAAKIQRLVATP